MQKFWKNNKGFIVGILLLVFFRSAIADWYHVPTGSMKPNILIGDRVWVNKLAYDTKVPFSAINLYRHSEPLRGDIVVFYSEKSQNRLIKRVIGVPGDSISMYQNRLFVNDTPVEIYPLEEQQPFDLFLQDRTQASYFLESNSQRTEQKSYPIRISQLTAGPAESFQRFIVPEGYFGAMGDNRNNSADSRVIGLIPRESLIGRAEQVIISFNRENYYLPRSGRYFEWL